MSRGRCGAEQACSVRAQRSGSPDLGTSPVPVRFTVWVAKPPDGTPGRAVAVVTGPDRDRCRKIQPYAIVGIGAAGGCGMRPIPRGIGETTYRDRPEDDDRQHADHPVEDGDRRRLGEEARRKPPGEHPDHACLGKAEAGRAERDRGQERPDESHEHRPGQPDLDVGEAKRKHHDVEPKTLGQPDQPGQEREDRQVAEPDGAEDTLLEAVVQLVDRGGDRGAGRGCVVRSSAS